MAAKTTSVVIVEDDPGIRKMLSRVLADAPGLVLLAAFENGEEALAGVSKLKPRVVVMDIQLPGMNGIDCTRAVREISPETHYLAKEIADQLSISFFTVRFHIRKIYEKLHVRSKTEAILRFLG